MTKIGIIGSDNSHADAFSKLLNIGVDPADEQARLIAPKDTIFGNENLFLFPDYKVTALYGEDDARNAEVMQKGAIEQLVEKPEALIGKVDAVMIVWRHGDLHYKYAKTFIEAGIPTWIDKPFTNDPAEARAIFELARKNNCVIAGGSTMKYLPRINAIRDEIASAGENFKGGSMTYAVSMVNDYGNIFFYGAHLVECALSVFGYDVKSVFASENDKNGTSAMLNYEDKSCVLHFIPDNYQVRTVLHIGGETKYYSFDIPGSYYYGFSEFAKAIEAKKTVINPDEFIKSVDVLSAIHKSALCGCSVKL